MHSIFKLSIAALRFRADEKLMKVEGAMFSRIHDFRPILKPQDPHLALQSFACGCDREIAGLYPQRIEGRAIFCPLVYFDQVTACVLENDVRDDQAPHMRALFLHSS